MKIHLNIAQKTMQPVFAIWGHLETEFAYEDVFHESRLVGLCVV